MPESRSTSSGGELPSHHYPSRNRQVRLQDLKTRYATELRERTFCAYASELHQGVLRANELEEEVWKFYRHTTPSLQEFYSRYTPEWEAFYSSEHLPPGAFLEYLQRMQVTFRRRYELTELNVGYYIRQLAAALQAPASSVPLSASQLQAYFLDRWHTQLSRKESAYQLQHIDRLCESFTLLKIKAGKQSDQVVLNSRVEWLLHTYPELYQKLIPYEPAIRRHPALRQLVQLLGKKQRGQRSYDAWSGIPRRCLVSHASASDIRGITLGNDFNHLLPMEVAYLADDTLQDLFLERFAEKRLQQFDARSHEQEPVKERGPKVSGQGPYILCVDTSSSMQGERERLSKSAILAIAQLTDKTHRKCYVINFSDEAVALQIEDLGQDVPKLAAFLDRRFEGGTDIAPALREASRVLRAHDYREADVVLISDFEMPPLSNELRQLTTEMRRRKTRFYALVFGNRPETDYLNLCDRYWEM